MRSLTIAGALESYQIHSDNALVFALTVDVFDPVAYAVVDTLYLVNHTTDLTIDGQLYVALPFMLDIDSESGEIPTLSLTIEDQAEVIMPQLKVYRGAIGSTVTVSVVTVTPQATVAHSIDFTEQFFISASSAADYVVTLGLGAENPLLLLCPRRRQLRDRCSFHFKSPECGYTGAKTSCDFTLTGDNGCVAHDNVARYGGFPAITVMKL